MKIVFRPPNFNCQVSHKGGSAQRKMWILCYALDENRARVALDSLNFVTHKVQPYDFETGWRREAREELKAAARVIKPLIAAGRKPVYQGKKGEQGKKIDYKWNDELWSKLKIHLVILFHNKCAYCQKNIGNDVRICEVEHYRPKGAVTEDPLHPGYWWLAYEPTNYLPVCKVCNGFIKMNHFPLMDESQRVRNLSADLQNESQPVNLFQDLAQEQPVIINPYQDDPADYLSFIPVCKSKDLGAAAPSNAVDCPGYAKPKNKRGDETIKILQLNTNTMLVDERRKAQQSVSNALATALATMNSHALRRLIQDIQEGNQDYYTAAMAEVQAYFEEMGFHDPFQ